MILKMFAIYDRQTEIYHPPLYAHSIGHILRTCGDLFKNPETPFFLHPADYDLFEIGLWDDSTGRTTQNVENHKVCTGPELAPVTSPDAPTLPSRH